MPDQPTRKRARFALADLEKGDYQAVAAFLARIGDVPEPELKRPRAPKRVDTAGLERRIRELELEVQQARIALLPPRRPNVADFDKHEIRPQPKPQKRHVDRDNLASFAERFPDCAIIGCRSFGEIDTHHLRKKSVGGSDSDENLLRLHRSEHDEYHRLGAEGFRAKYASRLKPTDLLKIRLAGELEAEAKLAGRECVDLDAEGM